MKRTLLVSSVCLFALGWISGWLLSPVLARWLQAAMGLPFVSLSPYGLVVDRLQFALASGVLVAVAPLLSRWTRGPRLRTVTHASSFLVLGLQVSLMAAWLVHWQVSSFGTSFGSMTQTPGTITYVSRSVVFTRGIPVVGCAMMILFALVLKVAGRASTSKVADELSHVVTK